MSSTRKVLGVVVSAAVVTVALGGSVHAEPPSDTQLFVNRINELRAANGVKPLVVDERLSAIAHNWAVQMAGVNALSHNPELAKTGPPGWTLLGENVGVSLHDVDVLHQAFAASARHFDNMVDPRYSTVGVGVVLANNAMWVAEEFMAGKPPAPPKAAPKAAVVKAASKPAPKPAPKPTPAPAKKAVAAKKK